MINLLPASEKRGIRKEFFLRVLTVCLAMLSLVVTAAALSFFPTYYFVLSRYEAFLSESQSDEIQNRISQVKDMEAIVKETNKKIELAKKDTFELNVEDILRKIQESENQSITITGFSYGLGGMIIRKGISETANTTIIIQGISKDRDGLLAFKDALSQKKEFAVIDLPISSLVKDMDLGFLINISIVPNIAEKTK